MGLDQLVFAPHSGVIHAVFGDVIAYQLEYVWVRGQGEYGHDHASRTRRRVEGIVGMGQMVQEVAIKQCFSLLLQANGGIQLGLGLAWQQRGQKMHVRSRRFRSEEHTSELQSLMRISYAV